MRTRYCITAFAAALLLLTPLASAQQLLDNGGFETGNATGWTIQTTENGSSVVYDENDPLVTGIPPAIPPSIEPPPEGEFAFYFAQTGPARSVIYQDVTIPGNAVSADLSGLVFIENAADGFITPDNLDLPSGDNPNQQMRIDVMDPSAPLFGVGAGVLLNVYQTEVGDPNVSSYSGINGDLAAFAGQTVRIRVAEVNGESFLRIAIDDFQLNVEIEEEPPPEEPPPEEPPPEEPPPEEPPPEEPPPEEPPETSPRSIPALSGPMTVILALLLGGIGGTLLRRR